MRTLLHSLVLMLTVGVLTGTAQVPGVVNYQGTLTGSDGTPVADGSVALTFRLYDVETGGLPLWEENQTVETSGGVFSVVLGDVNPLYPAYFNGSRWLGIAVGAETEMTPRIALTSVPYSLLTAALSDSIVTGRSIAAGAISPEHINASGASAGQALTYDGSGMTWSTPSAGSGGLSLPYAGFDSTGGNAFSVTQSGNGRAANFDITNSSSSSAAMHVATNGSGNSAVFENGSSLNAAVYAKTTSTGNAIKAEGGDFGSAIWAEASESSNGSPTLYAINYGFGGAAYFETNNASNFHPAVYITDRGAGGGILMQSLNSGSSKSLDVQNWGSGITANLSSLKNDSKGTVLKVEHLGKGVGGHFIVSGGTETSVHAQHDGFGHAGFFQTTEDDNDSSAVKAVSVNLFNGAAGEFINTQYDIGTSLGTTNNAAELHGLQYAAKLCGREGGAVFWHTDSTYSNDKVEIFPDHLSAAKFSGDVAIVGTLSKSAGTFVIDHPQDPANRILRHSFVESPEMTNIYKGRAKLVNGEAVIELPGYFDALNHSDGREINLTCVNGWSPLYLEGTIENNQFTVKTTEAGNPCQEFSWVIYGVRNDAYAKDHPVIVEQEKGAGNSYRKGQYLYEPRLTGTGR